jgi:hypothetical protein
MDIVTFIALLLMWSQRQYVYQWNRNTHIYVDCTKVHVDLTFAKHLLTAVMSQLHAA